MYHTTMERQLRLMERISSYDMDKKVICMYVGMYVYLDQLIICLSSHVSYVSDCSKDNDHP
jgi:hypothetical protein